MPARVFERRKRKKSEERAKTRDRASGREIERDVERGKERRSYVEYRDRALNAFYVTVARVF